MNVARKLVNEVETRLDEGTVVRVLDGEIAVSVDGHDVAARRAKSCLVAPEAGDRVLVAFGKDRQAFVLAVLEGARAGATLASEGDLSVKVAGRFDVTANDGVDLVSGGAISFVANAIKARAFEADLVLDRLAYVGRAVRAEVQAIKTIAAACDGVFERVTQRAKRSFRFVEEADTLKAGRIDYAADTALTMRAKNAVLAAEELAKVDAEQIQLG
jgi:Protein of unknown function (DUF3540)